MKSTALKSNPLQLALDFRPHPAPIAAPAAIPAPFKPTFTPAQQRILYALKHEGRTLIENLCTGQARIDTGWIGEPIPPATLDALKRKQAIRAATIDKWGTFRHWVFAS